MKIKYEAPNVEIEKYILDMEIAASCSPKITLGPSFDAKSACEEFKDMYDIQSLRVMRKSPPAGGKQTNNAFAEAGLSYCDCYYSADGDGYFTS